MRPWRSNITQPWLGCLKTGTPDMPGCLSAVLSRHSLSALATALLTAILQWHFSFFKETEMVKPCKCNTPFHKVKTEGSKSKSWGVWFISFSVSKTSGYLRYFLRVMVCGVFFSRLQNVLYMCRVNMQFIEIFTSMCRNIMCRDAPMYVCMYVCLCWLAFMVIQIDTAYQKKRKKKVFW